MKRNRKECDVCTAERAMVLAVNVARDDEDLGVNCDVV